MGGKEDQCVWRAGLQVSRRVTGGGDMARVKGRIQQRMYGTSNTVKPLYRQGCTVCV